MEEYLQEQNISLATDGAPVMVGRYRGFATLLKQNVPHLVTVHCVLHRTHLITKKLSGELHEALIICFRSINKIKHALSTLEYSQSCVRRMMKLLISYSCMKR